MSDPKEHGIVPREPSKKSGYQPPNWYWESRKKGPTSAGTILFVALRALDLPFQYYLLTSGLGSNIISSLGGTPVLQSPVASSAGILGLSSYHSLVMGLATGSALKQIYWKLAINDLAMPAGFSVTIAFYNTILNTLNTCFALWSATSQQPVAQSSLSTLLQTAPPTLLLGIPLYAVGLFVEWYCEVQRAAFKAKPENKGKPYSGGLFGVVRNVNYTGYTLWRTGYSLICAGWTWGAVQAVWLAGDFCARAIPCLDTYCEKRYGEQWEVVRRDVPWKFIPGIY
jgi:protein-S-isoprenylcysteine O-methyltransferase Ste14